MRNLIVIVPDTLRRLESVRGLQIERDARTLCSLAQSSLRFSNAVSSSPWTLPSHDSLLNGREAWMPRLNDTSSPDKSLATAWREAGGESIALSVNPLVSERHGTLRGYDETGPKARNVAAEACWTVSGGLDILLGFAERRGSSNGRSASDSTHPTHLEQSLPSSIFAKAGLGVAKTFKLPFSSQSILRRLSHYLHARKRTGGLHLFINLMDVHEPYIPARLPSGGLLGSGWIPGSNLAIHSRALRSVRVGSQRLGEMYLSAVRQLDQVMAEVMGLLRRTGHLDDALLCVASDHGQSLGENGVFGHGRGLDDEVVQIPALLWDTRPGSTGSRSGEVNDWVDHRHIYAILHSASLGGGVRREHDVTESVQAVGPAVSFVAASPPKGFNPMDRQSPYRAVRVWDGNERLAIRQTFEGKNPVLSVWGSDNDAKGLLHVGARILNASDLGFEKWSRMIDESDISARLASWGYT